MSEERIATVSKTEFVAKLNRQYELTTDERWLSPLIDPDKSEPDESNPIVHVRLKTVLYCEPGTATRGKHCRVSFVRADGTEIGVRNALAAQFSADARSDILTASILFRNVDVDVEGKMVDYVGDNRSRTAVPADLRIGELESEVEALKVSLAAAYNASALADAQPRMEAPILAFHQQTKVDKDGTVSTWRTAR